MPNLKRVMIGGKAIWIETEGAISSSEENLENVSVSDSLGGAVDAGSQMTETIAAYCGNLIDTFKSFDESQKPDTITAEFGLKLSGEGNLYLVKTVGEASLKITAQWRVK
jgi:hypothetical protein